MIISSRVIDVSVQEDGRSFVTELHVTDKGNELRFIWLADKDVNLEKAMHERAAWLNAVPEAKPDVAGKANDLEAALQEFKTMGAAEDRMAALDKKPMLNAAMGVK